ncbi:MFS transporter [Reticulibacter mediterranei]|uniref:MFS transporter n=1 Tax=Reticulibacter mediterranei TaxID=2778369 RepID=A0A8J3I864_9CHLR|nr:MFS transporter [Reticulibacter mediterranei]GHO90629.1 MFS transporter [Reticulibacter mediterranei]
MANVVVSEKKSSLLTNHNYLLLWTGQSLSLIGDYFFLATIMLWLIEGLAKGQSWLPLATGGVVIASAIPSLLISPLAGVFVDRWNRRGTMLWTDLIRGFLVTIFLLETLLVHNPTILLPSCFAILLLISCGTQFFLPARVAVVADIISPEQHHQAYGSLQQASYFAQIVGPSIAAPLYVLLGPSWAIGLNAVSFFVSFLVLLILRIPKQEQRQQKEKSGFWNELLEGYRFFIGNRILVTLLITGMIFMFAGMAYNAFEYLYGIENLHIRDQLLGLYVACYGTGVVIGLPITAALAKRLSEVKLLWLFLIGHGIIMLALSRMTTIIPGMICGLLLGFLSTSIFISVRPLTLLVTPRTLIGRVMAFETPMITLASLSGGFLAGLLASTALSNFHAHAIGLTFGRLDTIFVGIGLLTIGAGIFARLTLYPAVRAFRAKQERDSSITAN